MFDWRLFLDNLLGIYGIVDNKPGWKDTQIWRWKLSNNISCASTEADQSCVHSSATSGHGRTAQHRPATAYKMCTHSAWCAFTRRTAFSSNQTLTAQTFTSTKNLGDSLRRTSTLSLMRGTNIYRVTSCLPLCATAFRFANASVSHSATLVSLLFATTRLFISCLRHFRCYRALGAITPCE
ncbi:uncharacterized protein M421DRAFT_341973 [Didymella exigua CBS 183.55]|uniref:Uncharacterized protein n=1 Tax=Didymella exigua CBS 183.55 TaxID=1150837 RepID=A0A6A5RUF8_9PLEO|nr:uncharacterized protein M421DRAFT_341973 [Didymella exigua CBS 183.55]KAF1931199.1 hypothetical protein M421DRAFT_341973 [Didymella exigua CBS 183.55]